MHLKRNEFDEAFLVRGYSETGFRVAGRSQEGAVLIAADYAEPAPITRLEELTAQAAEVVKGCVPSADILLLGTGKAMQLVPSRVKAGFEAVGLSIDVMDTGAAARTYNVLIMEDRPVACLLFPLKEPSA